MKSLAVILALALLTACVEDPVRPEVEVMELPIADGKVAPVVVDETGAGDVTILRIRMESASVELGAYQGRMTFDPTAMEFLEASMPDDGYRVVNTLRAEVGEIRFAGFSVVRFANPDAVVLRFRARQPAAVPQIVVIFEVIGDVQGRQVPRERILAPSFRTVQQ